MQRRSLTGPREAALAELEVDKMLVDESGSGWLWQNWLWEAWAKGSASPRPSGGPVSRLSWGDVGWHGCGCSGVLPQGPSTTGLDSPSLTKEPGLLGEGLR